MRKMIRILSVIGVVLFAGCATTDFSLRKTDLPGTISLCVGYDQTISTNTISSFNRALGEAIDEYNQSTHQIHLSPCADGKTGSIKMFVTSTRLVGPGRQALGCFVSTLGVAAPFLLIAAGSPVWVAFAYVPENYSYVSISLSDDINGGRDRYVMKNFTSFPYFGSIETQNKRHSAAFKKFIRYNIKTLLP